MKAVLTNFNLLHIGAIVGHLDIFKKLLSIVIHAPALLSSRDKLMKLKVIDYAYLSKNKQIIDTITDRRIGEEIEVQLPSWQETLVCKPVDYFILAII